MFQKISLVSDYQKINLDDMAKNFPAAEKAQLERIKELRVSAMLGARDWREMLAAFRNKSGV